MNRSSIARILAVALAAGCLLLPSSVLADDKLNVQEAKKRWEEGMAAAKAGEYEKARVAFFQAYNFYPDRPEFLRVLAVAEIDSEHYLEGARHLATWFKQGAPGVSKKEIDALRERLASAETKLVRLQVKVDEPSATIRINEEIVAESPTADTLYAAPGALSVSAEKDGRRVSKELDGAEGQHFDIDLNLNPTPLSESHRQSGAAPAAHVLRPTRDELTSQPENSWRKPVLIGSAAVAVLGLGAGTYFAIRSNDLHGEAEDKMERLAEGACNRPNSPQECKDLYDTDAAAQDTQDLAYVSFGVGALGTLGFLGTLIFWPDDKPTDPTSTALRRNLRARPSVRLIPQFGSNHTELLLEGQF